MFKNVVEVEEIVKRLSAFCITPTATEREMIFSSLQIMTTPKIVKMKTYMPCIQFLTIVKNPISVDVNFSSTS